MNFYAGLHNEGLKNAGLRHQYILNADETEVYQLYDQFETEEHLVYFPFDSLSTSPVYIVQCGSHTSSMYAEALQLAQINPSNSAGNSYEDYPSFEVAKQLPLSVAGNQVLCPSALNRPIIMTGYSLGGVKTTYSHYYNSDVIHKTVVFNPWIGEFESGVTFDPAAELNPWHDQRLAELHSLTDPSEVPSSFRNIYINYVEGEFASKLWQSESSFNVAWNVDPQVLQCSWGVNRRYSASFPSDAVPSSFADMLSSSTQTGHDRSINNFLLYPLINIQNPYLYIKGPRIIASAKSYLFPNHDAVNEHSYLFAHVDDTLQLQLFTDSARTDDDFKFNLIPVDYVGGTTIQPTGVTNNLTNLLYQLILVPNADGKLYYITTNTDMYAHFPNSQVTPSFKRAQQPPHLAIEWKTFAEFNATSIRTSYKWHISPVSYLHSSRRLLDPNDYDPLQQLKSNDDITWVIKGSERSAISNRYLETIANGAYHVGSLALVMKDSDAASASPSGVQWKIEWDPTK